MTAVSDETGRGWLPLKYEDGPDFCTVTFATGAAFALTVHPERMKLMEAALSAAPVAQEPVAVNKLVNAILNELFRASDNAVIAHNTVYELKPYIERAILSTLPRASLTK